MIETLMRRRTATELEAALRAQLEALVGTSVGWSLCLDTLPPRGRVLTMAKGQAAAHPDSVRVLRCDGRHYLAVRPRVDEPKILAPGGLAREDLASIFDSIVDAIEAGRPEEARRIAEARRDYVLTHWPEGSALFLALPDVAAAGGN